MTLWQFGLSFLLGGAVSYGFGTAAGLRKNGTLQEHPVFAVVVLMFISLAWPILAIRNMTTVEEESHE